MRFRGLCLLLSVFAFCSCLCISISAVSLPIDDGEYVPEGFEAIVDETGLSDLPDVNITRNQSGGISLFAAEAVGWRQMIIYKKGAGYSTTGSQGGSISWNWGEESLTEYVNKTLVPGYTYSLGWTHDVILSGYGGFDGWSGAVCSDLISLTPGDVIAGDGFTVQLQAVGTSLRGYVGSNSNYLIGIVDSSGELIKTITSKRDNDKTWKSSFSSQTVTYTFPSYQFEATETMEDVRLVFWAGASGPPSSSGSNYGAFSLKIPEGQQFSVYLKTSVVEGSGAGGDDTSGLLAGIIEWLGRIWDGILSIPSAIVNLGVTLLDGIKELFIPSGEEIQALYNDFTGWLDTNFPLLMLPLTLVTWIVNLITSVQPSTAILTFPEISWMGHVLIPATAFDFSQMSGLETLLPWIRFFGTLLVLWSFGNWIRRKIHSYWSDGGDSE